ncbi:MAG TPA: hypothetical protein VLM11_15605, partial [Streptosporangiaceae bacterium]|nr:hypothetical protein [Streptosporangiaceae bacterium]
NCRTSTTGEEQLRDAQDRLSWLGTALPSGIHGRALHNQELVLLLGKKEAWTPLPATAAVWGWFLPG